jgi:hypothetical protein
MGLFRQPLSVSYDGTFLSPLIKGGRGVVKRKVWKKNPLTFHLQGIRIY